MRRRGSGRFAPRLACILTLAFIAASCGGDDGESTATTNDGTQATTTEPYDVAIALAGDLQSLDPQKVQEGAGRTVFGNIFDSLLDRTPDGRDIVPVLATGLPEAIDDTTWEVTLRDDVTFASGKQLTADDVVYTFDRLLDPAYESEQAALFDTIASTEAVDDTTVRFTTSAPDPIFVSRLTYAVILPVDQAEVVGFPDDGLDGTGPYQFVSHTPDVSIVLEKRDDYWGDASGAPQRVTFQVVPEPATRLASLQANELDIVSQISPEQTAEVPQSKEVTTTESALIRTNALRGPFADVRLREAANLAINREAIVETLFNGQADVSTCQISTPNVFGHTDSLEAPEHDPERARELVEEAYNGEVITFYGVPQAPFAKQTEVAQAVAQDLQDVGLNVDLQFPQSVDVLRAQFTERDQFVDLFIYSSNSELFDEQQQLQWLTSDGIYSAVDSPEIDRLAAEAASTLDEDARQETFDELNQLACDEVLNLYLYYASTIYGLSDSIDWEPRADGRIALTDIEQRE